MLRWSKIFTYRFQEKRNVRQLIEKLQGYHKKIRRFLNFSFIVDQDHIYNFHISLCATYFVGREIQLASIFFRKSIRWIPSIRKIDYNPRPFSYSLFLNILWNHFLRWDLDSKIFFIDQHMLWNKSKMYDELTLMFSMRTIQK